MNSSQNQNQQYNRGRPNRTMHESFTPENADNSNAEIVEEKFPDKPSYFKYTLANPYNLTLLGGAIVASILTLNPLIAVAALGVEGLWLLHGSQSRFMQRMLWDPIYEK